MWVFSGFTHNFTYLLSIGVEKMQIFMCGQDVIWQFGVLVSLEQKSDQEHFICKSEADAINLYDHLMARLEDQHS